MKISLNFGLGQDSQSNDFLLKHSHELCENSKFDVLIFADSRGVNINDISKSWVIKLYNYLNNRGISVLLVTRPKDCTVFLTLLNFLKLNNIKYKYLINQVGFVDFTPKKKEIIDDILSQKNTFYKHINFKFEKLPKYKLLDGNYANLYSIDFEQEKYKSEIVKTLVKNFEYSILVGTVEFLESVKFERERPREFYTKLNKTNEFLLDLSALSENIHFTKPTRGYLKDGELLSYDGVHYTDKGHTIIFNMIKNILRKLIKLE